jgi:predicted PurR-regulated permease PerM
MRGSERACAVVTERAPAVGTNDRAASPEEPARQPGLRTTTRIELPWRTIARILLVLAVLWLLYELRGFLLTFLIALLLTAAFDPPVRWLQRRGIPRSGAVGLVFLAFIAGIVGILLLLIPPLVDEARAVADRLPELVDKTRGILQNRYPSLYERLQNFAQNQADSGSVNIPVALPSIISVGAGIVTAISDLFVALVMTAYLLLDGRRIYRWSVRYLPDDQEAKVRQALPQISHVVAGYVAGQVLTSALFGIFAFTVLSIVGVPQAVFLAVLAAILDAVPIVGVAIATVPAALLALTGSVADAAIVVGAYIGYQQIENHYIVPKVYSGTLQISSFAVLVAVVIGGELLGILGALLALPIAAAIPVVERIWIGGGRPGPLAQPPDEGPPHDTVAG